MSFNYISGDRAFQPLLSSDHALIAVSSYSPSVAMSMVPPSSFADTGVSNSRNPPVILSEDISSEFAREYLWEHNRMDETHVFP